MNRFYLTLIFIALFGCSHHQNKETINTKPLKKPPKVKETKLKDTSRGVEDISKEKIPEETPEKLKEYWKKELASEFTYVKLYNLNDSLIADFN